MEYGDFIDNCFPLLFLVFVSFIPLGDLSENMIFGVLASVDIASQTCFVFY
jgi:hypothetical protein